MTNKKQNPELKERQLLETGTVGVQMQETWRPKIVRNIIAGLPPKPGFIRKGVIINYPHMPENFQRHEDAGYKVVYALTGMIDERSLSQNQNAQENTVPSPLLYKTKDGYDVVVMEIEQSKWDEYEKQRHEKEQERYKNSVKSIQRKGKNVEVQDEDFVYGGKRIK